ncbi:hypothetical protein RN001_002761 [Aquatica leii]|uniref:DDE Tnp4 domain-containing protein n=1 Tax=Aquatica leii TaxID=1421715 RepID=A0AAN7QB89_9COLE|nr:hypothetical protein RN001_002761 [Aquatica leii]
MEEQLEVAILGGANDEEIEQLILYNVIGVAIVDNEEEENIMENVEFNLNNMTNDEIKLNFRFQREDITRLKNAIRIPQRVITNTRNKMDDRHDAGIFRESNLYQELEQNAMFPNNENYVLYGDQAYGVRQLLYNNTMKVLRVAVEWGFQKVISQFAFVDLKKNQKLLCNDIESFYKCAVLLTNCHTCLYGSQTAEYFNIMPPVLEEFIG